MPRSKFMLVLAVIGLSSGVPLALGMDVLGAVSIFLRQQGPRLLGSILVALSLAVLVRQMRSRPAHQPGRASDTSDAVSQAPSNVSHQKVSRSRALLEFRRLLPLAALVSLLFIALAFGFMISGRRELVTLGLKIFELSTQAVLVAVLGGVLVQAYIKWHSTQSSMNELRQATAESVIREYFAAKKVRRLLRAECIQGPGATAQDPWTDIPLTTYDRHMSTINEAQLALEVVKRRLQFYSPVFQNAKDLTDTAEKMEKYLGEMVDEYELQRNRTLKRDPIPLRDLKCLRGFIAKGDERTFDSFATLFDNLLRLLEAEVVWVAS